MEHIHDCIEAVLGQKYPIEQIIVIDNHSTDQTSELLTICSEQVNIIFNESNTGFAAAHNKAIQMSTSDYCLILNPDVTLDPDYVAHLVNFLESNPGTGSVTGKLLLKSSPDTIDSTGLVINKARRAFDRGSGKSAAIWNDGSEIFGVSGAAAIYSRKMIDDISIDQQFFDQDFFAYKEDVDVAWRAQLLGWFSYYVPEATAFHERGWKQGARNQQPLFIRRHSYINRYRMILKNDSIFYYIKHLPIILMYEAMSFGYMLLIEPMVLKAWLTLFIELPSILRKRKVMKQKVKTSMQQIYRFFK
jgi:GT2 family glycosyltransferase